MPYLRFLLLFSVLCCGSAAADIWQWVDADGETHFVDTVTSIYTWVDDGKIFYSDTPGHEDAVAVQLVWVSKGALEEIDRAQGNSYGDALPGETPEERAEREHANAYYCKRATTIYDSYKNAPRLYSTNEAGEREYLTEEAAQATLDETKSKMDGLCN